MKPVTRTPHPPRVGAGGWGVRAVPMLRQKAFGRQPCFSTGVNSMPNTWTISSKAGGGRPGSLDRRST